jgi:DNA-binding transcriptional ArsR family regulator
MRVHDHFACGANQTGDLLSSCASAKTDAVDNETTILALAALAQPTRLEAFRTLVAHEPHGVPAGELARLLAVPQNTLSAHLNVLARGGLVKGTRHSRSIIYRADLAGLRKLMVFLVMEELAVDKRRGFFVNHDLAGYEVPIRADIPHQEVIFLDETDPMSSPMKAKGVAELGICGVGAAIANAVYNATGVRVRDYPITLDKLLGRIPEAA